MPVENPVNGIWDLVESAPSDSEGRKDGDDHLRNIKKAVKETFPQVNTEGVPVGASSTELNYLDGANPGNAVENKAIVVDGSKNIDFGAGNISTTGTITGSFAGVIGAGNTTISGFLDVSGATTLDGDVTLGDTTADDIIFRGIVQTSIFPSSTTNDLGSTSARWGEGHFEDVVDCGSISSRGNCTLGGGASFDVAFNGSLTTSIVKKSGATSNLGSVALPFNNIYGPLTGNVTGDVDGDVTGNVTGDVTGDLNGQVTAAQTNINIDGGNIASATVLANGIAATTQSTSDNSTKLATTAFVKNVLPAGLTISLGATITRNIDLNGTTSGNHGFGANPSLIVAVLECFVNDKGYVVGDQIPLNCIYDKLDSQSITVYSDSTQIHIAIDSGSGGDYVYATDPTNPSGGDTFFLDRDDWRVVAKAYNFT